MKGKNSVHFKNTSDERETPKDFFNKLNRVYNFTLDPCATDFNAKCKKYYTKLDNGLKQDWGKNNVWVNPPYSKIDLWLEKIVEEKLKYEDKINIVLLMPARTDTRCFHKYIWDRELGTKRPWVEYIDFIKGRIKFVGMKSGAPFPSMIVKF